MTIALDTSAYLAYLRGHADVKGYVQEAGSIVVPCTVIGELYAAFYGGTRMQQNTEIYEQFIADARVELLIKNSKTAKLYGSLFAQLKSKGTPISINDVWIAAESQLAQARLITLDSDFKHLPDIDAVILKPQK